MSWAIRRFPKDFQSDGRLRIINPGALRTFAGVVNQHLSGVSERAADGKTAAESPGVCPSTLRKGDRATRPRAHRHPMTPCRLYRCSERETVLRVAAVVGMKAAVREG